MQGVVSGETSLGEAALGAAAGAFHVKGVATAMGGVLRATDDALAGGAKGVIQATKEAAQRYSGDLIKVNKQDVGADMLAQRIGGTSRVKFSNDPLGREFDAVSERFIGQTKPGGIQMGSPFRDQAKATFKAAKATGKSVYYHFNGEPGEGVVDKLKEYGKRYEVDTREFGD